VTDAMPKLTRPCGSISYDEIKAAQRTAAPAVLLSHGFGATAAMFAPNVPTLAAHRDVITWDLRGHGASESPSDPECYSAAHALDDMRAILDTLGITRAVLGGHSLGGYLSLSFTLAHPDQVAALILIGTGPGFRKDEAREAWNRRAHITAERLSEKGIAALGDSSELHGDAHADDVQGLVLAAQRTLTQRDARVIDGLPGIRVPALIIVGENDKNFLAAADYMAGKIPAARKVVIPDAGHAPNVDQPERVNAEMLAFLADLS
jgi:pimeloyl-ACP methyl ester carboxylesterase